MIHDLANWVAGEPVSATKLGRMTDAIRDLTVQDTRGDRARKMRPWQPFDVEPSAPTSVRVHAGPAVRIAAGSQHTVEMTIDSGTSDDPDDYKTLTGITTTCWIKGTLNSSTAPTTLTIATSATFPSSVNGTVLPIAYVICAGSVITRIIQLINVEWLSFEAGAGPDNLSINENTDGELQVNDYETATDVTGGGMTPANFGSLVPMQPAFTEGDPLPELVWIAIGQLVRSAMLSASWSWGSIPTQTHGVIGGHGDAPAAYTGTENQVLVSQGDAGPLAFQTVALLLANLGYTTKTIDQVGPTGLVLCPPP